MCFGKVEKETSKGTWMGRLIFLLLCDVAVPVEHKREIDKL